MRFVEIDFSKNFFILTREDFQKISFPYSTIEYLLADPVTGKMRIEVKKHGQFWRDYENPKELTEDFNLLMAKGKNKKGQIDGSD